MSQLQMVRSIFLMKSTALLTKLLSRLPKNVRKKQPKKLRKSSLQYSRRQMMSSNWLTSLAKQLQQCQRSMISLQQLQRQVSRKMRPMSQHLVVFSTRQLKKQLKRSVSLKQLHKTTHFLVMVVVNTWAKRQTRCRRLIRSAKHLKNQLQVTHLSKILLQLSGHQQSSRFQNLCQLRCQGYLSYHRFQASKI